MAIDKTLAEAATGIGHWAAHVKAQTDAFAGRIDGDELAAVFRRTRLAGPEDQARYRTALQESRRQSATCAEVDGATARTRSGLARCRARLERQDDALEAGAAGMRDWQRHLAAMARSRHEHVPEAQDIWLEAWRQAPPHLKAWDRAQDQLARSPSC